MILMICVHIQTSVDGIHLYELPGGLTIDQLGDQIAQLRAAHGVPDDWIDVPGQYVAIASTPVHPLLLAVATVHPLEV